MATNALPPSDLPALLKPLRSPLFEEITGAARALGLPLFLVGGCVRDLLLGIPPLDLDFVVEGNAPQLAARLVQQLGGTSTRHQRFITATWDLTSAMGTIADKLGMQAQQIPSQIDFASARQETYPFPGALPVVTPSPIQNDLFRRDFTINAIAIPLDDAPPGALIDPYQGLADLQAGIIRPIHANSFSDDPTRIFRALRFAQRFGFKLAPAVLDQMPMGIQVLPGISGERLRHELEMVLAEPAPARVLQELAAHQLLQPIHPALSLADPLPRYWQEMAKPLPEIWEIPGEVQGLPRGVATGMLAWLNRLDVTQANEIAERLAFPQQLRAALLAQQEILLQLPVLLPQLPISQRTIYLEAFPKISLYSAWVVISDAPLREALTQHLSTCQHTRPHLSAHDLLQRGIQPGPRLGALLRRLRAAWLDGQIHTPAQEAALLEEDLHNTGDPA